MCLCNRRWKWWKNSNETREEKPKRGKIVSLAYMYIQHISILQCHSCWVKCTSTKKITIFNILNMQFELFGRFSFSLLFFHFHAGFTSFVLFDLRMHEKVAAYVHRVSLHMHTDIHKPVTCTFIGSERWFTKHSGNWIVFHYSSIRTDRQFNPHIFNSEKEHVHILLFLVCDWSEIYLCS